MKHNKLLSSRHLLVVLIIICLFMMMFSYLGRSNDNINNIIGKVVIPVKKVISKTVNYIDDKLVFFDDKEDIITENKKLTIKNEELQQEIVSLELQLSKLQEYSELYDLDKEYSEYNKIEANVIANDGTSWFSSFTIDKGTDHGLSEGMNVLANGGLVGKIVKVGDDWSQVRTIVDTSSFVSAMTVGTGDYGILTGNLELSVKGRAQIEQLYDSDDNVNSGDMIVTSNISDVYWPGLLIGYLSDVEKDSNNLTKKGEVTLAADLEHLRYVLVITDVKDVTSE